MRGLNEPDPVLLLLINTKKEGKENGSFTRDFVGRPLLCRSIVELLSVAIKFRAIHTTRRWRKAQHASLSSAIDGPDGAKNLLRRIGRVGAKWKEYGPVLCVFVWDENINPGLAFRLKPGSSYEIERAEVPLADLNRYELAKGCSEHKVEDYFSKTSPLLAVLQMGGSLEVSGSPVGKNPDLGSTNVFPEELPSYETYPEGLAHSVIVNAYERSASARTACIEYYKAICQVCKMNFEERYGEIGHGYIHVHHLVPVSSIGTQYQLDPIKDLLPVCANCHAMLHRRDPPLSIGELRRMLKEA